MRMRYNGEFCELLGTLSKRDNFSIVVMLLEEGPLNISEIYGKTELSKGALSRSLGRLGECGYVFSKKQGRERIFYLNKKTVVPLLKLLGRHAKRHLKNI